MIKKILAIETVFFEEKDKNTELFFYNLDRYFDKEMNHQDMPEIEVPILLTTLINSRGVYQSISAAFLLALSQLEEDKNIIIDEGGLETIALLEQRPLSNAIKIVLDAIKIELSQTLL